MTSLLASMGFVVGVMKNKSPLPTRSILRGIVTRLQELPREQTRLDVGDETEHLFYSRHIIPHVVLGCQAFSGPYSKSREEQTCRDMRKPTVFSRQKSRPACSPVSINIQLELFDCS